METLPENGTSQKVNLPQNNNQQEVAILLFRINLVRVYPLTDGELSLWAREIISLLPDLDLKKLKLLIDKFVKGEIKYDNKIGLPNIFIGLKQIPDFVSSLKKEDLNY